MQVDENLIREAQSRTTGATVHRVTGLILRYRLAVREHVHGRTGAREDAEAAEERLRRFAETGRLEP